MPLFEFKVNVSELETLAEKIGKINGELLGQAVVSTLNAVVDRTYDLARSRINQGINLTDDYVKRKLVVERATSRKPEASITSNGAKEDQVPLRNFDAKMVLVAAKDTRGRRNTGAIGIPKGKKQRAVQIEVSRGGAQSLTYGFMLPLRAGTVSGGNGLGVFARSRDGQIRHRYGPAVYQLFKHQIPLLEDDVAADMEKTLGDYAQDVLEKALQ